MENGVVDETTGANRTAVTFGVSSYIHRLGFYAQCNLPITQKQYLDQPELRVQAMIGFMYFLSADIHED